MLTVLLSLLILGALVIVHELGHFLVARWFGVRILRFSVGFGPTLASWKRGHTEYALSALPLGGYVKMAGEQRPEPSTGETPARGEPWEYLAQPIGTRAAIILAGPLVNYLVAFVTLWAVFVMGYPELLPVVGNVLEGTPAQAAGLQAGDRILAIDGREIRSWHELTALIYDAPDRPLDFRIARAASLQQVTLTPQRKMITDPFGRPKTVGQIGVAASGEFQARRVGPIAAVGRTLQQHGEVTRQTLVAVWLVATWRLPLRESITGPIGIVSLTSDALHLGLTPLLVLVSLFSLSLALFNLFPIPILDGGHLFFLALEKLRGRPISLNVQERSIQVSFMLLVAFVAVVCLNDVNRFGLWDRFLGWFSRP
ncbi:MAG: site-2 protease family protein [Candidatus Omnitrophota bacterium]|nr:site-2 protease family protein [Candidatus Omnitrophota bacterium]